MDQMNDNYMLSVWIKEWYRHLPENEQIKIGENVIDWYNHLPENEQSKIANLAIRELFYRIGFVIWKAGHPNE